MKRCALIVAVTGAALLAPAAAYGVWTVAVTPGTTTASAAGQVLVPAGAKATTRSSTAIDIAASAPSGNGVVPTSYRVQRNGTTVSGCDSLAFNQTCSDSGLSAGTGYAYAVLGRVGTHWVSSASTVGATTTAAPAWVSATAGASTITAGQGATWTVVFSQPVSGVSASAFQVTGSGTAAAAIASVTPIGSAPATTWTVTSGASTGTGSLRLDLQSKTGIADSGGSGLSDTALPISGGTSATVTVNAPAPTSAVAITGISRNGNSSNYTFTGTSSGGGAITVTVSTSYTAAGCSLGTPLGTQPTASGSSWTSGAISLTSGSTYYVRATISGTPPATSRLYAVTAPTTNGGSATTTQVC